MSEQNDRAWKIEREGEGCRIRDAEGRERGRYRDPIAMALGLTDLLQSLDRMTRAAEWLAANAPGTPVPDWMPIEFRPPLHPLPADSAPVPTPEAAEPELMAAARQALDRMVLPRDEYDRRHKGNVVVRLSRAIAASAGATVEATNDARASNPFAPPVTVDHMIRRLLWEIDGASASEVVRLKRRLERFDARSRAWKK